MKRIVFSDQAKAEIRAIPRQTAMQILTAVHRLAETGAGRIKRSRVSAARSASGSVISGCASRKRAAKARVCSGFIPSGIARTPTADRVAYSGLSCVLGSRRRRRIRTFLGPNPHGGDFHEGDHCFRVNAMTVGRSLSDRACLRDRACAFPHFSHGRASF